MKMDEHVNESATAFVMGNLPLTAHQPSFSLEELAALRQEYGRYRVKIDGAVFSKKYRWEVVGVRENDEGQNRPTAISRVFPGQQTLFVSREAAELQLTHFERWLRALAQGEV